MNREIEQLLNDIRFLKADMDLHERMLLEKAAGYLTRANHSQKAEDVRYWTGRKDGCLDGIRELRAVRSYIESNYPERRHQPGLQLVVDNDDAKK